MGRHTIRGNIFYEGEVATDVIFTKMSAKSGINKFGEKEVEAMVKNYIQIDKGPMEGRPFVTPIDTDTLSYKDKRKVLEVVNIIKEKRNGTIKGSKCADGSKQKRYLKE